MGSVLYQCVVEIAVGLKKGCNRKCLLTPDHSSESQYLEKMLCLYALSTTLCTPATLVKGFAPSQGLHVAVFATVSLLLRSGVSVVPMFIVY